MNSAAPLQLEKSPKFEAGKVLKFKTMYEFKSLGPWGLKTLFNKTRQ